MTAHIFNRQLDLIYSAKKNLFIYKQSFIFAPA